MTLAPIRGAPPGAPIPAFPVDEPKAKPVKPTATPACDNQLDAAPRRQPHTPIEIGGGGNTLVFRVIAEIPAIMRPSMTIHVIADAAEPSSAHTLGFLRMSAANAREFLAKLRDRHSPIVATGDEDGTVQIEFETAESGSAFSVRKHGEQCASRRCLIDRTFDMNLTANELLGDLGA
jgi:hypothetical protein